MRNLTNHVLSKHVNSSEHVCGAVVAAQGTVVTPVDKTSASESL